MTHRQGDAAHHVGDGVDAVGGRAPGVVVGVPIGRGPGEVGDAAARVAEVLAVDRFAHGVHDGGAGGGVGFGDPQGQHVLRVGRPLQGAAGAQGGDVGEGHVRHAAHHTPGRPAK